mgnify:CR=1 FL=1
MNERIVTPTEYFVDRFVSLKELRDKLLPRIHGWSWADDAINDLWKLGSISPQSRGMCPNKPPCPARECPHVTRLILSEEYYKWAAEVDARIGSALTAEQVLRRARVR